MGALRAYRRPLKKGNNVGDRAAHVGTPGFGLRTDLDTRHKLGRLLEKRFLKTVFFARKLTLKLSIISRFFSLVPEPNLGCAPDRLAPIVAENRSGMGQARRGDGTSKSSRIA
jgi:hypothetical protein